MAFWKIDAAGEPNRALCGPYGAVRLSQDRFSTNPLMGRGFQVFLGTRFGTSAESQKRLDGTSCSTIRHFGVDPITPSLKK